MCAVGVTVSLVMKGNGTVTYGFQVVCVLFCSSITLLLIFIPKVGSIVWFRISIIKKTDKNFILVKRKLTLMYFGNIHVSKIQWKSRSFWKPILIFRWNIFISMAHLDQAPLRKLPLHSSIRWKVQPKQVGITANGLLFEVQLLDFNQWISNALQTCSVGITFWCASCIRFYLECTKLVMLVWKAYVSDRKKSAEITSSEDSTGQVLVRGYLIWLLLVYQLTFGLRWFC